MDNQSKITCLQLNANHDKGAIANILAIAKHKKAEIILLADPYINIKGSIPAPGWTSIQNGRTAILIPLGYEFHPLPINHPDAVAIVYLGIMFVSVYAPPNGNLAHLLDYLDSLNQTHTGPAVFGGDFNCTTEKIPGHTTNQRGTLFNDFLDNGFTLLNNSTHTWSRFYRGHLRSHTLDYTFTSSSSIKATNWSILPDDCLSDHNGILFELLLDSHATPPEHTILDYNKLLAAISALPLQPLPTQSSQESIDTYIQELNIAIKACMTSASHSGPKRPFLKWWDNSLNIYKNILIKLGRLILRVRDPIKGEILRIIRSCFRRIYKSKINENKIKAWRDFCNQSDPWGLPYYLAKKSNTNVKFANPLEKITLDENGSASFNNNTEKVQYIIRSKFPHEPSPDLIHSMNLTGSEGPPQLITSKTVTEILKKRKNRSAPGHDNINHKTLKALHKCHPVIIPALLNACNYQRYFPAIWKTGDVKLIPKPGKDLSSPDGYRPITLLPTLGKTFEHIIKRDIESHLEENHLLSKYQFGFRKQKSTEVAIHQVMDYIKILQAQFPIVAFISLDIRSAFDSARWSIILQRCCDANIPHYSIELLKSYFTQRYVSLANIQTQIHRGCPQGSVLGPLLWNIAFNPIISIIESEQTAKCICYADDTAIILGASDPDDLLQKSKLVTTKIIKFLSDNGLSLNVLKSEAIILDRRPRTQRVFAKTRDRPKPPPCTHVIIGDTLIPGTDSLKYLGVIIDKKLCWNDHISYINKKADKYIPILTSICHNLFGYSNKARLIMVNATIAALYNYCSTLFFHRLSVKSSIKKAQQIQRRAAIICSRLYRTVSHDAALVIARIPPIDLSVEKRSLLWLLKHNRAPEMLNSQPTWTLDDWANHLDNEIMSRWQKRWDLSSKGRWTHQLLPLVSTKPLHLDFYISQGLSGHGCFLQFLHRFSRSESPLCSCGQGEENAEHVLRYCSRFQSSRRPLPPFGPLDEEALSYIRKVVRALWDIEKIRETQSLI